MSKPPGSLGDAGREVWGRLWVAGRRGCRLRLIGIAPRLKCELVVTHPIWPGPGTCFWLGDQDVVAGAGAGLCAECARAPQRRRGPA